MDKKLKEMTHYEPSRSYEQGDEFDMLATVLEMDAVKKSEFLPNLKYVIIDTDVEKKLLVEKSTEICGVLVGKKFNDSTWRIFDVILDENPEDSSREHVVRDIKKVWDRLNIYARDHPGQDYIGEFHTHTDHLKYYPSTLDDQAMGGILGSEDFEFLDEVILGISCPDRTPSFWLYTLLENSVVMKEKMLVKFIEDFI